MYLIAYTLEEYPALARMLRLWPYPRAHHQHAAIVPQKGSTFVVADRRFCPLLPKELQMNRTAGMQAVHGTQQESCTAVCE